MHPEFCYIVGGLCKSIYKVKFMLNDGLHNPGGREGGVSIS